MRTQFAFFRRSHNLISRSILAERNLASSCQTTDRTESSWSSIFATGSPSGHEKTSTTPSSDGEPPPTATCLPSGEKATQCRFSADDLIVRCRSNLGQTCMCKPDWLTATMDVPSGEKATAVIGGLAADAIFASRKKHIRRAPHVHPHALNRCISRSVNCVMRRMPIALSNQFGNLRCAIRYNAYGSTVAGMKFACGIDAQQRINRRGEI